MLSINYPILEDTNPHIVFIRAPFPDNAQLIDTILDHLAHNRGVKLEGFREPDIIEALSSEYMAMHWNVQPARLVEVHGRCSCVYQAIRRIPEWVADTFRKMETPGTPYKKMLHSEFIAGLTDPTRSEKVLDVPMAHRGAPPPFGCVLKLGLASDVASHSVPASWTTVMMRGTIPRHSTIGLMDFPGSNGLMLTGDSYITLAH